MNGVLHSEHVISRSGIAVSPREVKKRTSTPLALRSAGVAFLSTTNLWGESAVFSNARRKAGVPTGLLALSVLQQFTLFKFFLKFRRQDVAGDLHHSDRNVALTQHLDL